jgi:hypothetical protein
MPADRLWRILFAAGGVIMAAGGPLHPRGETMHSMLIDPNWFP